MLPRGREDRLTSAAREDRRGTELSWTTIPALPGRVQIRLDACVRIPNQAAPGRCA